MKTELVRGFCGSILKLRQNSRLKRYDCKLSFQRQVLMLAQAMLCKELTMEHKNQDDISHLTLLKKHFWECEEIYQVTLYWCTFI
jgi:hypothetical protein